MGLNQGMTGRPRDASIDERVLAVTRELLVEVGWDDLSLRLVAARSGVGRSSLNRRWASKAELVLHAILGETPDMSPFSGTDLAGWIDWVVRGSHELFSRADVSAAVPGLLLALRENGALRKALWESFSGPAIELFVARGYGSASDAKAVLSMAAGAAMLTTTVAIDDDSAQLRHGVVRLLRQALAGSPSE
ncbi:TetR family transcriptional regulator [Mycobacterium sp. E802]|nr:TetR family transcriptional regulator [Mycobacterium sp. E802]